MHDHIGVLQSQQLLRPGCGGLRHYHCHRNVQHPPGISHGHARVAAGRRHKPLGPALRMNLAGMANATNLEAAGRLQRLHLEPDSALCGEAEGAGLQERGGYVEVHW